MSEPIKVPSAGEPAKPPLSDYNIERIIQGLLIPNQGASKSMAKEIRRRREEEKQDAV